MSTKTAMLTTIKATVSHAIPRPGRFWSPSGSIASPRLVSGRTYPTGGEIGGPQVAPSRDRLADGQERDAREHRVDLVERDPARLGLLVVRLRDLVRVDGPP